MQIAGEADTILFESPSLIVHRYNLSIYFIFSKQECNNSSNNMIYLPPSSLIQEISKSLASIGLHQGKKSKRRKEKKTIKAVDEEVDMFAD